MKIFNLYLESLRYSASEKTAVLSVCQYCEICFVSKLNSCKMTIINIPIVLRKMFELNVVPKLLGRAFSDIVINVTFISMNKNSNEKH